MNVEIPVAPSVPGKTDVLAALQAASTKTGADFKYLLAIAMRESRLDALAKSKVSSAAGLFQFVEQTWLGLVKRYGERHGLGDYSDAIHEIGGGRYGVASHDAKSAILALRKDPEVSALMAGEAANETKQSLQCTLGRDVCGGELYAAHFLGAGGARRLFELKETDPDCAADLAFPTAAKANRNIFYHADGTAKSVNEVYDWALQLPEMPDAAPAAKPSIALADVRGATQAPKSDALVAMRPSDLDVGLLPIAAKSIGGPHLSPSIARSAVAWTPMPDTVQQRAMLPQPPLLLSPAVVEILAALKPFDAADDKDDS